MNFMTEIQDGEFLRRIGIGMVITIMENAIKIILMNSLQDLEISLQSKWEEVIRLSSH